MQAADVFLDESGTTGSDFFDGATPHLVTAAAVLSAAAIAEVDGQLQTLRKTNRVQSRGELKYVSLRRSTSGLGLVRDIGRILVARGAVINYAIVEKAFNVCAMMVETYLDPEHNPKAPAENQGELRAEFANIFHEALDLSLLQSFAAACKADDVGQLAAVGVRIADRLDLHFVDAVRLLASTVRAGARNPFRFGAHFEAAPALQNLPASLSHAFLPALIKLNLCLEDLGLTGRLIADEDAQFGPLLDWIFALPGSSGIGPEVFMEFVNSVDTTRITGYERLSSERTLGVQLADLCAGIAREVVLVRSRREVLPAQLHEAWEPFAACSARSSRHFLMLPRPALSMDLLGAF